MTVRSIRAVRPEAPLYNPEIGRWWVSARQRVIVMTFPTEAEALAWDETPTLDHLEQT